MRSKIIAMALAVSTTPMFAGSPPHPDKCVTPIAWWVQKNSAVAMTRSQARNIVWTATYFSSVFRVPRDAILATMRVESRFHGGAVSSAGARGIMQVMPQYHASKIAGRRLSNNTVGIEVGTKILAEYTKKAGNDMNRAYAMYSGGSVGYKKRIDEAKRSLARHTTSCQDSMGPA